MKFLIFCFLFGMIVTMVFGFNVLLLVAASIGLAVYMLEESEGGS